jgi:hypothetical protein
MILRFVLLGTVGCLLASAPHQTQAQNWWEVDQTTSLEDPVKAGQRSLARLPPNNWYDAEEDNVTARNIPAEQQPPGRPGKEAAPKKQRSHTPWSSRLGGGTGAAFLSWTVIWTVLVILLVLVGLVVWGVLRSRANLGQKPDEPRTLDEISSQVDKVEHLPFEVKRPDANLLSEARRHYEQGDFNEAIIYLFSYQLLELDKGQVIRLAKGKTNGQYLMEMRYRRPLQDILRRTVDAFEDVFFGHRKLTREQFEACWNQLSQFQMQIEGVRAE